MFRTSSKDWCNGRGMVMGACLGEWLEEEGNMFDWMASVYTRRHFNPGEPHRL